ncbi:MAG TPA: hypothetical protein VKG92_12235 [Flavobacteriales bacterium]|nr:hypothetical protein [Flavobacteriales bacterium]
MPEFKAISKQAIPQALAKATRYRLLNEPAQAESICRDVLLADPTNQDAIYALILALTDRFGHKGATSLGETLKMTEQLTDPYHREYARGIIYERHAGAALEGNSPHAGYIAYEYLHQAMTWFEKAEQVRPDQNEDPILRWNACVRMIQQHRLKPSPEEEQRAPLGE